MPDGINIAHYRRQNTNEVVFDAGSKLVVLAGGEIDASAGMIVTPYAQVTLTSTQVLALNATPRTVVAAPGANLAMILQGAVLYKPAGTAYVVDAGDDIALRYTDGSGLIVATIETAGFLDQTTAQMRWANPYHAASGASQITPVANAPLVAHMLTGEVLTGDSSLIIRAYYRVVPTVLS